VVPLPPPGRTRSHTRQAKRETFRLHDTLSGHRRGARRDQRAVFQSPARCGRSWLPAALGFGTRAPRRGLHRPGQRDLRFCCDYRPRLATTHPAAPPIGSRSAAQGRPDAPPRSGRQMALRGPWCSRRPAPHQIPSNGLPSPHVYRPGPKQASTSMSNISVASHQNGQDPRISRFEMGRSRERAPPRREETEARTGPRALPNPEGDGRGFHRAGAVDCRSNQTHECRPPLLADRATSGTWKERGRAVCMRPPTRRSSRRAEVLCRVETSPADVFDSRDPS